MPRRLSTTHRALSALVAAACLAMLLLAAWLRPSPAGHGTHTQMGMPPCQFLAATGRPCPTCGMTTAVTHAAHGHLLASWLAQPFGLLVAIAASAAFWVGSIGALTGLRIASPFGALLRPPSLWTIAAAAALAWGYKIATWPA